VLKVVTLLGFLLGLLVCDIFVRVISFSSFFVIGSSITSSFGGSTGTTGSTSGG